MTTLVVTSAFGPYQVGNIITDPTATAAILAGPNQLNVVTTNSSTGPGITAPSVLGLFAGETTIVTGTYFNGTPAGLSYSLDGGAAVAVSSPTIAAGLYSFSITTPAAGAHTLTVTGSGANTATSGATGFITANRANLGTNYTGSAPIVVAGSVISLGQGGATSGQALVWSGTAWVPSTISSSGGALGTATPLADGTAAAGSAIAASHEDHRHPTDTSRAPLASPAFTGSISLPTWTTSTRPGSPVAGMEGFATDTSRRETYTGTGWVQYVRTGDIPSATGGLLGGSGTAGTASAVALSARLSLTSGTLDIAAVPLSLLTQSGAMNGQVPVWNGTTWLPGAAGGTTYTATAPLVLTGTTLSITIGTSSGSVAAGNDSRITGALQSGAIPAASGQLLGGSGTAGAAVAVTIGSGLSLSSGTLSATGGSTTITPVVIDGTTIVASTGSPYQMQATDRFVIVNKTTGAPTKILLPTNPTIGVDYKIKDGKGDAATNNITVAAANGVAIDGAATFVMNSNLVGITPAAQSATVWWIV